MQFQESSTKNGCALFAFDLTPHLNSSDDIFELIKNGNIRLELYFAEATPHTLTVIVFAEHDRDMWRLTTQHKHLPD